MLQTPACYLLEKQPEWSFWVCAFVCMCVQTCVLGHNQWLCFIKIGSVIWGYANLFLNGGVWRVKTQAVQRGWRLAKGVFWSDLGVILLRSHRWKLSTDAIWAFVKSWLNSISNPMFTTKCHIARNFMYSLLAVEAVCQCLRLGTLDLWFGCEHVTLLCICFP